MKLVVGTWCCLCGREATSACGRCKLVNYCGAECQKEHWKIHKTTCLQDTSHVSLATTKTRSSRHPVPLCGDAFHEWFSKTATVQDSIDNIQSPPVGLRNLDQNCYMNAILQCLLHTPLLAKHLEPAFKFQDEQWLREFVVFFLRVGIARTDGTEVSAGHLRDLMARNEEFVHGKQADAHEAFMFIVSKLLHACVEAGKDKHEDSLRTQTYQERDALERHSFIGCIFGMDAVQTVACTSCNYNNSSTRAEYCLCISLQSGLNDMMQQSQSPESNALELSIDICALLSTYTRKRCLEDFTCEVCGSDTGVRWEFLQCLPDVLTIYVDRSMDGKFGKLKHHVRLEQVLHLDTYLKQSASHDACAEKRRYFLYAVVVHKDTIQSTRCGHYVAYVRGSNEAWFLADDARIEEVSWPHVQSQEVYMALYFTDNPAFPGVGKSSLGSCSKTSKKVLTGDDTSRNVPLTTTFFDFDDLDLIQGLPLG